MALRLHLPCRERVVDTYSTPRWIRRWITGRHHTRRHCFANSHLPEPRRFGGLVFIGSSGGSVGVHPPAAIVGSCFVNVLAFEVTRGRTRDNDSKGMCGCSAYLAALLRLWRGGQTREVERRWYHVMGHPFAVYHGWHIAKAEITKMQNLRTAV